ncbi:MAG: DUF6932 family protein [Betaproteobacteria bacterium]
MPIPTLQPNGLLPTGVHECSLEDISAHFTWNDHRSGLFRRFLNFLDAELKPQFPYPIYFDVFWLSISPTVGEILNQNNPPRLAAPTRSRNHVSPLPL